MLNLPGSRHGHYRAAKETGTKGDRETQTETGRQRHRKRKRWDRQNTKMIETDTDTDRQIKRRKQKEKKVQLRENTKTICQQQTNDMNPTQNAFWCS